MSAEPIYYDPMKDSTHETDITMHQHPTTTLPSALRSHTWPLCYRCDQHGHIAVGYIVCIDHCTKPFHTTQCKDIGHIYQQHTSLKKTYKSSVVGECKEVSAKDL